MLTVHCRVWQGSGKSPTSITSTFIGKVLLTMMRLCARSRMTDPRIRLPGPERVAVVAVAVAVEVVITVEVAVAVAVAVAVEVAVAAKAVPLKAASSMETINSTDRYLIFMSLLFLVITWKISDTPADGLVVMYFVLAHLINILTW